MAGTKEIKNRISGVQDTRKITNAMYLIASTKLRKAKAELDSTRPYFNALRGEIKRIFRSVENLESPYLFPAEDHSEEMPWGCLVITADKGLAGAYNHNVLKMAEGLLEHHPDTELFVVGEFGRQYFKRKKIDFEPDFPYSAQSPTMERARKMSSILLRRYLSDGLGRIYIIYSDMANSLSVEPRVTRLLPLHKEHFSAPDFEKEVKTPFEFSPSPEEVLNTVVPSYLSGYIYSALVASFCCEQNERMRAMDSANRNAEKILDELSIQYNRVRQGAITQEITEVSAGARAQKLKETKEVPLP
ncbi:MAG: ATP synthase F1 subunit gamma [Oscillospiraceae bacterium]|nr:ATP synthase F1 subunit gamma [Oscillospiraceae bacterium]